MSEEQLSKLNIEELLSLYTRIEKTLMERKLIRTRDIVQGYGEYLASKLYNFKLADNVIQKGYDGINDKGIKFQVKASKRDYYNTVFSGFKKEKEFIFDYAICILFDINFNIEFVVKIPYNVVMKYMGQRGTLNLNVDLFGEKGVDIHEVSKKEAIEFLKDL